MDPQARVGAHKDRPKPVSVLISLILVAGAVEELNTHTPCPGVRKIPPAREPQSAEVIAKGKGNED